MRITKRQLRRIIREEIETLEYPELKDVDSVIIDVDFPEDVEPTEDTWAGGANVLSQIDHPEAAGGEPTTRGQEISVTLKENFYPLSSRKSITLKSLADSEFAAAIKGTNTINEQWGAAIDTGSPLIEFARAYMGLGDAVASQVDAIVEAYNNSSGVGDERFNQVVYEQNSNAIAMAMDRLGRVLKYGELGDQGDDVSTALEGAQDLFLEGEMEVEADASAAGDR